MRIGGLSIIIFLPFSPACLVSIFYINMIEPRSKYRGGRKKPLTQTDLRAQSVLRQRRVKENQANGQEVVKEVVQNFFKRLHQDPEETRFIDRNSDGGDSDNGDHTNFDDSKWPPADDPIRKSSPRKVCQNPSQ